MLNPERLGGSPLNLTHSTGSNSDDRNNRTLFNGIVDGALFSNEKKRRNWNQDIISYILHLITLTQLLMKLIILNRWAVLRKSYQYEDRS